MRETAANWYQAGHGEFALGYWRLNEWGMNSQALLAFIEQHIELGISTVDHAALYGNPSCEQLFGDAIHINPSLRKQLQIVTKCGINVQAPGYQGKCVNHYDSSASAIIASVEESLRRLRTDHIDVLLLHRPDYLLDAEAVAACFSELKAAGKVLQFGVSNYSVEQFKLLQAAWGEPLVTNQVEINPINLDILDSGVLEQAQRLYRRPMAWSCLAGGRLFNDDSERAQRLRATLQDIAHEIGAASIEQVVYAWVRRLPSRPIPILGTGNIERARLALGSQSLLMNHEQWCRIWIASKGHNLP